MPGGQISSGNRSSYQDDVDTAEKIRAVILADGENINRELINRGFGAYRENLGGAAILKEARAAIIVGVTADCLKKWRQRKQGLEYILMDLTAPFRHIASSNRTRAREY